MVRSLFARRFGIVEAGRVGRDRKAQRRQLQPSVDGLEERKVLTATGAGSVVQAGILVIVTPSTTPGVNNNVTVSYQQVSGVMKVDVNLNGTDNYFTMGRVAQVLFEGSGTSNNDTFTNKTGITSIVYGGNGNDVFYGGSGIDDFYGGSGTNTFYAGTGYDMLEGGSGSNTFDLNATGSGTIYDHAGDTINDPPGMTGTYQII